VIGLSEEEHSDKDVEVFNFIDSAREALLPFVTSEWATVVPEFVKNILETIHLLEPGQTLGDAFPEQFAVVAQPPQAQAQAQTQTRTRTRTQAQARAKASALPSPATASSSSLFPPLPPSTTPSPGSAISRLPTGSDPEQVVRPTRPIPRRYRGSAAHPPSATTTPAVVPPAARETPAVVHQGPVTRRSEAATDAAPVASTSNIANSTRPSRAAKKKTQKAEKAQKISKAAERWFACNRCRKNKKGCQPLKGDEPPYITCALCVQDSIVCSKDPKQKGELHFFPSSSSLSNSIQNVSPLVPVLVAVDGPVPLRLRSSVKSRFAFRPHRSLPSCSAPE
jgi:hypothetical protein